MKLIALSQPSPLPADFPEQLRNLADQIERGEVSEFVGAYVCGGNYEFLWPSSLHDSLVLVSLLKHATLQRFQA